MIGAVALIILFASCVVFVNLTTARSVRRALEVGVRKACGATRAELILQFLGESVIYVVLATCLALALAPLLLPSVNAFLNSGGHLDFGHDPALIAAILVGMLAGLVNGLLVTKVGLSALVSTLGMNFLIRGLIQIGTQGEGRRGHAEWLARRHGHVDALDDSQFFGRGHSYREDSVGVGGGEFDDAKRMDDRHRHAILTDPEILSRAFGLRAPIAVGGNVDRTEAVGLAAG